MRQTETSITVLQTAQVQDLVSGLNTYGASGSHLQEFLKVITALVLNKFVHL